MYKQSVSRTPLEQSVFIRICAVLTALLACLAVSTMLRPHEAYADGHADSPNSITNSGENVWITNTNITMADVTILDTADFFTYTYADNYWDPSVTNNVPGIGYSGGAKTVTNPLYVTYSNAGVTSEGVAVDLIFRCTSASFQPGVGGYEDSSGLDYPASIGLNSERNAMPADRRANGVTFAHVYEGTYQMWGGKHSESTWQIVIQNHETHEEIPNARILVYYLDLDQINPDHGYGWNNFAESIRLNSNFDAGKIWVSPSSCLNKWYDGSRIVYEGTRSTGDDIVSGWQSGVAVTVNNGFSFSSRPSRGRVIMNFKYTGATPPPAPTVSKSPDSQIVKPAKDTVSFTFPAHISSVISANQYQSITFSDALDDAYDMSTIEWDVTKNGTSVKSHWSMSTNGQTLNISTTDIPVSPNPPSYAPCGDLVFTVTAKLKAWANYNYKARPIIVRNNKKYIRLPNTASIICKEKNGGNTTGTSNEVEVLVEPKAKVRIQKNSAIPVITGGNRCYTLAGAEYRVYSDANCTQQVTDGDPISILTTTESGASNVIELYLDHYWIREWSPSTGMNNSNTTYDFELTTDYTETPYIVTDDKEPVLYSPLEVPLVKEDRQLNSISQGDTLFKDAVYTVKYFDTYSTSDTPDATGKVVTADFKIGAEDGKLHFASATPVPGSVSGSNVTNANTWPYRVNNQNVFPLGTVTIKEKTAPDGYNLDTTTHVFQVVEVRTTNPKTVRIDKVNGKWKNSTANDFKANEGEVFRGKVRVFKYDKDAFNDGQENSARITQGDAVDSDGNSTFKGTTYKITNMSRHAIWVNGVTYEHGAALPLIVASVHGEAVQEGLPYGTYTIEEVDPITGYLPTDGRRVPAWKRTFEIREDNQEVLYDQYDPEDPFFRNLDQVIRGGLEIHKVDYDTRENWTQGDAGHATSATNYTFAKTTYTIWNRSKSYVYVNGYRYPKDTVCATIESDAQGIASLPNNALPYGTYEVYEENPSPGYLNSGWHKTFTIRQDGQVVIYNTNDPTDRANQDTHQNVNGDFHKNYEHVMRGDVIVNKLDWDTEKSLTTQGDAGDPATNFTFAGTTYAIKNVSRHPVYIYDNRRPEQDTHADHLYDPGEICLFIVTDASGVARTTGKTLPYGSYEIYEYNPTTGYMNVDPRLTDDPISWPHVDDDSELYDRVWHRTFTIDEDGDVIAYDQSTDDNGRLRNEEPVIRGGVEVHKVDADTGLGTPQGMAGFKVDEAYTFAGATYEITNESRHHVKVYWDDGSQRWVEAQGGVCGRIKADASGIARLDANALPYGTYTIREVLPSDGYRNSGWSKTFTVRRNNEIVKFDGTDTGNHQNQNTSDVVDADFKQNYEPVQRGGVTVSKVDAQTRRAEPQGDASLAGTVYSITNLSRYDVMVADAGGTMHSYAPYEVCLQIASNANGVAETAADALPYGHYSIQETTPPSGYHNSQWQQVFDITRHRDHKSFTYVDNSNYDIVKRNPDPIEIRKYDNEYGDQHATGAATLNKTMFKITNQSLHAVLVNDVLCSPKATVMTIETGSDGTAYIAAGAFPVGRYEVTEVAGPRGYTTNSSWSQLITVDADGHVSISGGGAFVECRNDVIRGDVRLMKVDAQTGTALQGVAFAITSKTTGERHIVVTGANGILNTASTTTDGGIPHTTRTNLNDSAVTWSDDAHMWVVGENASSSNGVWFHGRLDQQCSVNDAKGALPYDTYVIEELRCAANRDYSLSQAFEITINKLGYADDGTPTRVTNEGTPPPDPMREHGSQVTIYKDSTPAPNSKVNTNDEITYKLSLRNTGKDVIERSLVRDYIPVGTDYVEGSASDGGVYVPANDPANGYGRGYIEWAIDDFIPRSTRYTDNPLTFKVKVRYDAPSCIENTSYVKKVTKAIIPGTPGNPEPDLESNTVYHKTGTKDTPAFVRIIKDSEPAPGLQVAWRSLIDYTLTVKNTGGSVALNTAVYDKIPEGTTYVSMDMVHGATLAPGGTGIGWIIDRLDPGESTTLKFRVKVTDRDLVRAGGFVSNQASWGDLSNIPEPTPPTSDLDNTTDIIEHPLYEAPPEDAETYKWSDPEPETVVKNGDEITYILTTVNKTAETKPYTIVRDYIPEGTQYVENSASDGGAYVAASATGNVYGRAYVEWVLPDILPRKEKAVTFKVKVIEDWRTYIRDHAFAQTIDEPLTPGDPKNPEPSQITNEVKHRTPVAPDKDDLFPFVRVVKDSDPIPATMVDKGRRIKYTLTVRNDGKAPAYDVRVYDAVPEGTDWVSTEPFNVSNGDEDARRSTLPRGDARGIGWVMRKLDAGAEVKLVFTVEVVNKNILLKNEHGDMIVRNQAAWAYENEKGEEMPSPPSSSDEMTDWTNRIDHPVPLDPKPQYGRQVTGYKDSVPPPNTVVTGGSTIRYEIRCVHTGVLPQEATLVRDYIPVGTEYVDGSATDAGVYVPANESPSGVAYVEWVLPRMVTGDKKSVFFEVRVAEGWRTFIRNHALTGPAPKGTTPGNPETPEPPDLTNEVWHTTDEDEPTPEVVQVVKDAIPAPGTEVERDSVIRYVLHVKNTGGSVAYNYGVHDVLQEGMDFVPGRFLRSCEGTVLPDGRSIAWVVPRLDPGETFDLWFEAKVTNTFVTGDIVQNQATWGKRENERDVPSEPLQNTSNIVEHPIHRYPRPTIKKEIITRNLVTFGDTVDFRVTVHNDGDASMDGWVLEDRPGKGLAYVSDNQGGEKQADGSVRWTVNLPPNESFTVKVRMTVTAQETGRLPNVATISKPDGSGRLEAVAEAAVEVLTYGVAADPLIKTGAGVLTAVLACGGVSVVAYRRMRAARHPD